jgi:hypothetical protein
MGGANPAGNKMVIQRCIRALPGSGKLYAGQEVDGRNELRNPAQADVGSQLRKAGAVGGGKDRHVFPAPGEQVCWQHSVRGTTG